MHQLQHECHCRTWADLEQKVHKLSEPGKGSALLFRGQADADWRLETTLDRQQTPLTAIADYYRVAAIAKTQIETFTSRQWANIDDPTIAQDMCNYDALASGNFPPHYDYLIYLRHHGFPSPLLDWSRSLYVAAYFACHRPNSERVAIFIYQERAGTIRESSSADPQLRVLGPNIRSHPRHFLQQGEYTLCAQYLNDEWKLAHHEQVFALGRPDQDRLWKLTLPSSEAHGVMKRLHEYNITAFSLFQTEESLLETLAQRHFPFE